MKTKLTFTVCLIADIPKAHVAKLKKQIEKTMGTTLDISILDLSYSINDEDYIKVKNFEEDYTQLINIEEEE